MAYRYNINPSDDKWTKLTFAQEGTLNEVMEMLNKHQISLMVRPTGFGKTHLMIELAKREKYEKVLYLYPMDVIRQSVYESYHKCDEQGNAIDPSIECGIKFADTESEHVLYPELPYIEFCTYSKMLEDYNNVYRFMGDKDWSKLSKPDKDRLELQWNKLDHSKQEKLRKKWIQNRFEHIELLILDEAHTAGAEGFLNYWGYIHNLTSSGLKANRLHVLGATATPLRTASDVDIQNEVFYYEYGGEKRRAVISEFSMQDCWRYGILQKPYYVKGILDKELEKDSILNKIKEEAEKKLKAINISMTEVDEQIDYLMTLVKPLSSLLESSVEHIAHDTLSNRDYMRFLIFYQKSDDLIDNHLTINNEIQKAFIDYEINTYYITSDIPKLRENNINISKVGVISERDKELSKNPDLGKANIDIIHSIDMLNMGYHVGKVTGVIIKRATGSEIRYYQQIGRCVSVASNNQPLVIDLANADAELFNRAMTTDREIAMENVKEFIAGCDYDVYQNDAVNQIYKYIGMCLDTEPMDKSMIDFWYFDRFAPIYFIWAISISLGKKETLLALLNRLNNICNERKTKLVLDTEFCKDNTRINKKVQDIINKEVSLISKVKNRG